MSGGFKWLEIKGGLWQVIAEEETGRVLAHVYTVPNAPPAAFVNGKPLGWFISNEQARAACEDHMSATRRYARAHAGRPMPLLEKDERAWMEDVHDGDSRG